MPTYRQYQDTRDGAIYNCVLMPDGKWWSAEDYRWDGSSWISPPNNGYWDATLAAARLYLRSALTLPPGTHLPSADEWMAMVTAEEAMSNSRALRSALGWAPTCAGDDIYGFGIIGANGGQPGVGWGSTGYVAKLLAANGTTETSGVEGWFSITEELNPVDYYASVRFIVDVFNEPIPQPIPHPSDFFPPPGTYENPQVVALNKIGMLYTLDGTDPTPNSPTFGAPIRISGPTEIRLKSPHMPDVFSFSYLVKGRPLPTYKQAALWADGKASPETITRTYNG